MTIQYYPDELAYINAKLADQPGDFLKNFLTACLHADEENYDLLRLVLNAIRVKYPLFPRPTERWKQVHRDKAGIDRHYALKHLVHDIVETCFCEMQVSATDDEIIDLIRKHLFPLGSPHLAVSASGLTIAEELP